MKYLGELLHPHHFYRRVVVKRIMINEQQHNWIITVNYTFMTVIKLHFLFSQNTLTSIPPFLRIYLRFYEKVTFLCEKVCNRKLKSIFPILSKKITQGNLFHLTQYSLWLFFKYWTSKLPQCFPQFSSAICRILDDCKIFY